MQKKRFVFFGTVLLLVSASIGHILLAQNNTIDSLEAAFFSPTSDSLQWEAARSLSEEWAFIQTDSALHWAQMAHDLAQQMNHPALIAQSLYQLGAATYDKRNHTAAMQYFLEALALFKAEGDERLRMDTELEIGLIYQDMKEYEKAREYLDRFYQYYLQKGEPEAPSIIFALNQYVVFFEKVGNIDSMLHYSRATLEAAERYQQTKYLANIHNNLASVYLYAGDYDQARYHFSEAERIGFGPNVSGRYYNLYALADMFDLLDQPDSSIHYAAKALEIARSFGDVEKESHIHRFLSRVFQEEQDFQKAFSHLDTFMILTDSVITQRYEQDLSELTIKYETQEKEARIVRQELQLQREANRRNMLLLGSLAIFLLLGGLLLYMRNRQRARNREAALKLQYQQAEAKRLRELDQLKSNFFANISHEFRTPLTLLLGPLREMEAGSFQGDQEYYFQNMVGQGERLLNLVNQMLDLSRLESGQMKKREQAIELVQFMRTTASFFESWADRKRICLQVALPDQRMPVKADVDKIEKILNNLLSNALKFTPEDGAVTISLEKMSEHQNEQTVCIQVRDNGPGIPADQLAHIFERFYQASTGEGRGDLGSGIGLALTKELVEFCEGTIEVDSEPGNGSCFTVILPFAKANMVETGMLQTTSPTLPADIPSPTAIRGTTKQEGAPLVLIVEDNPDLRTYVRDQLNMHYQLLEAENGRQGLELAKAHLPDLVISDVRMPEMDGLEFSQTLKTDEYTSHIPIILLTALAEQENIRTGLSTGADAYLTKPFDAEELRIRVHHLIDQRRKLREKFAQDLSKGPSTPEVANPADASFLKKVQDIVLKNLDNDVFSIEWLGREVAMSRSQLHRKIKALTDQSPSVFVRTLRLQHAYQLLSQKKGNISEIAHEVGMPNLAHFSRSFKEQFGVSPSQV